MTERWLLVVAGALAAALLPTAPVAARTLRLPPGHRSSEAHIAVDPTDPSDITVVARDENRGRFIRLRTWRSRDGGRTFRGRMLVDGRLSTTRPTVRRGW